MNYTLQRIYKGDDCVLGLLYSPTQQILACTLELPDKDNQRQISCIPAGTYNCVHHDGNRYKDVWCLENVANREAILIHAGNTALDVRGCILLGSRFDKLGTHKAVLNSKLTIERFKNVIGRNAQNKLNSFTLTINEL